MEREKTALISVYNKEGIGQFGKGLLDLGYGLLSSGGTAEALVSEGLPVKTVADLVQERFLILGKRVGISEEKIIELAKYFGGAILGHKVATLIPEVHGGLLADHDIDVSEMSELAITYIDLVCCDFYPLMEEIKRLGSTPSSVRKSTDIGGPTMIRSGAKGKRIVICDSADRGRVLKWMSEGYPNRDEAITQLLAKAEDFIGSYCKVSGSYHGKYARPLDELLGPQIS